MADARIYINDVGDARPAVKLTTAVPKRTAPGGYQTENGHVEISSRRFICEDPEGDMA